MEIRPIRSEADYQLALQELEQLWGAAPGTIEGDKLDILATLIEAYEEATEAVDPPDPIEALLHYLESQELTPLALAPYIGSEQQVNDVLNRKLPLSLEMIRQLRQGLGIPADILIQPYDLAMA